jgi:hypothetical protein
MTHIQFIFLTGKIFLQETGKVKSMKKHMDEPGSLYVLERGGGTIPKSS